MLWTETGHINAVIQSDNVSNQSSRMNTIKINGGSRPQILHLSCSLISYCLNIVFVFCFLFHFEEY